MIEYNTIEYSRLVNESLALTLRIFDEWNRYGRAEFMIRHEKALKESVDMSEYSRLVNESIALTLRIFDEYQKSINSKQLYSIKL